jgi:thioredoxin 1
MADVLAFTTDNFEQEVLQAEGLVMVKFYATWCSHCRRARQLIRSIAETYEGRLKVGKVDVFDDNELSTRYRIFTTPTVIFFRNGEEVARVVGSGVREGLQQRVEELLGAPGAVT